MPLFPFFVGVSRSSLADGENATRRYEIKRNRHKQRFKESTLARAFLSSSRVTEKVRTLLLSSWPPLQPWWSRARWWTVLSSSKDHRRCRADESLLRAKDPTGSLWIMPLVENKIPLRLPERKPSSSRHLRPRLRLSDAVAVVVTPWIAWSKLASR